MSRAALECRGAQSVIGVDPEVAAGDLLDGLAEVGGGILWAHPDGALWTVNLAQAGDGAKLYRHGALLVTASPAALGCAAWLR